MVLFIVICSLILIGIIFKIIYNYREKRTFERYYILGKSYSEQATIAKNEFESISNYGRFCTEEEFNIFYSKYSSLYDEIEKYKGAAFYSSKPFKEFHLDDFLRFFKNLKSTYLSNNRFYNSIKQIDNWSYKAYPELQSFFSSNHYFTDSEMQFFLQESGDNIKNLQTHWPYFKKYISNPDFNKLYDLVKDLSNNRKKHNEEFIDSQLRINSQYFNELLQYPLDDQQRKAIVTLEDNVLVISSAGSGKTSTIIGKANYLLQKQNVDPSKLLIITYTRKAAEELRQRLGREDVDCSTFHSLAVRIISKIENAKPSICEPSLLLNVFRNLLQTDHNFLEAVLNYILHQQSLMALEHSYDNAPDYFADRKKYGIQAPFPDFQGNIIFTRSEEEKRICTYLTELGVNFKYEFPYPIPTRTQDYRQYKPDFTIFYKEYLVDETGEPYTVDKVLYLEHFAINERGEVPKWFGDKDPIGGWESANREYNEGIRWKRVTHVKNKTTLIETTSADFHRGNVKEVLKSRLEEAGVYVSSLSPEELYEKLIRRSRKIESSVFKLLEQFIALSKSNCVFMQDLISKAKEDEDERTLVIIRDIIDPLLKAYTTELVNRCEIDFTDAIIKATEYCDKNLWSEYDYILVDEFQDISLDRYKFIQSLRTKRPLTKLFCVGDDWQSIYRFAGSNMKLFYSFSEFFGYTENCKIEKTYRLFEPLLSLSSDFIQRNPDQLKKEVMANGKSLPPCAIEFIENETFSVDINGKEKFFRNSDFDLVNEILSKYWTSFTFYDCGPSQQKESMLPTVRDIVSSIDSNDSILILGRYNYDIQSLGYDTSKHDFDRNQDKLFITINGRKIRFMSVHSAKGLESDHIIIINCNEGIYGFPSLVEDDPILSYVLSEEDKFEYAEERRLFYVALTRARKSLHVLYNGDKPSPFVRELTEVLKSEEMLCPLCQEGHMVVMRHATASNGRTYTNYGCSNYNAGCEYFERVFEDERPYFEEFNEEVKQKKLIEESIKDSLKNSVLELPDLIEPLSDERIIPPIDVVNIPDSYLEIIKRYGGTSRF